MKLTKKQFEELLEVSKPLMKWLSINAYLHCTATVDCCKVKLSEDVALNGTDEFIMD